MASKNPFDPFLLPFWFYAYANTAGAESILVLGEGGHIAGTVLGNT